MIDVYYYEDNMHTSFEDCMSTARECIAEYWNTSEYLSLTDRELSEKLYEEDVFYFTVLPLDEVLEYAVDMAKSGQDCYRFLNGICEQIEGVK